MALENDDLIVVQKSGGGELRKSTVSGLLALNTSANDGQINIDGGDGITATGDNATANQAGDTTRTLSIDQTWLSTWLGTNYPITPSLWTEDSGKVYPTTLTNNVQVGGTAADPNISLNADGGATFAGAILTGPNTGSGSNNATGMTLDGRTGRGQLSIIKSEDDTSALGKNFITCITTDGTPTSQIELKRDGGATFASTISVANFNSPTASTAGINLYESGAIYLRRDDDSPIFRGYDGSTVKSEIGADGSAYVC